MIALGIDTSTVAGSVGLAADDRLDAELGLRCGNTHSERLLPSVRALLDLAGLEASRVDLFAVAAGPGSFTGLRIGMAAAKGLALAVGRPLVGFSTLETLALAIAGRLPAAPGDLPPICALLDAGRGEVYRGLFRCEGGRAEPLAAEAALPPERAVAALPAGTILGGEGVAAFRSRLSACLPPGCRVVESVPFLGLTLARRALAAAADRGLNGLPPLIPNYLRLSDAEMTFKG